MWHCTFFVLIFVTVQRSLCLQEDYYWRDYTGTIPADAVVAGDNIDGKNVYIGQAYVHNEGAIVSEIFPGRKDVQAPINGIKPIDSNIKILCGPQKNFYWIPANATHLHVTLINKQPVIGGHETGGNLYIGRISQVGDINIGKIVAFNIGNAQMSYNHRGEETRAASYEILLYNGNNVDVRINNNKG